MRAAREHGYAEDRELAPAGFSGRVAASSTSPTATQRLLLLDDSRSATFASALRGRALAPRPGQAAFVHDSG